MRVISLYHRRYHKFLAFCVVLTTVSSISQSLDDDLLFEETSTPEAQASAPTPPSEDANTLPMDLPIFGTVNFVLFTEGTTSGMKAYIPKKGSQLTLGPLTLDQGEFRLINGAPSYSARATLFGSSATLSLKKAIQEKKVAQNESLKKNEKTVSSFGRIEFGVAFAKNPTIELMPGKKAELTDVTLALEKAKPVELMASATILGQRVSVTFSIDKEKTDAWMEVKDPISFDQIIAYFKGTIAEKIQLSAFKFTVKNLINKKQQKPTYFIEGSADLAHVPGLENAPDIKKITVLSSYTAEKKAASFLVCHRTTSNAQEPPHARAGPFCQALFLPPALLSLAHQRLTLPHW